MRALKYSIEEAVASLWRGRRSSVLSIVTIAAALFVLGLLLVVTWNLQRVLAQWAAAAEMSVYLRDGASAEEEAAIDQLLAESDLVAGREYVSKGDALVKFKRDFADLSNMAGDLSGNPFPATCQATRFRPHSRFICSRGPRTPQPSSAWLCTWATTLGWPTCGTTAGGSNG